MFPFRSVTNPVVAPVCVLAHPQTSRPLPSVEEPQEACRLFSYSPARNGLSAKHKTARAHMKHRCEFMIRPAPGINSGQFASRIGNGDRTRCGMSAMAAGHGFFRLDGGDGTGTGLPKPAASRSRPVLRPRIGVKNRDFDSNERGVWGGEICIHRLYDRFL